MRHISEQRLIDRGRKAGLKTSELYSALASQPLETGDRPAGATDGNGFVSAIGWQGRPTYRPSNGGHRNA
ncbi:hypothetical protein AYO40_04530 [Planctomycetaceae bacterium SCGC AG-212-D15]|nr:hypothetical protein AYO40_04530 [Planctomycetaceae bacterium SCGC AG-212-D15]